MAGPGRRSVKADAVRSGPAPAAWDPHASAAESSALREPPHSVEAEHALLGSLLLENATYASVSETLGASDLYRHEHKLIFGAIADLIGGGKPADVVTVYEQLGDLAEEAGGLAYLNALAQGVASAANVQRYAEIVAERSARRASLAALDRMTQAVHDGRELAELFKQAEGAFAGVGRSKAKRRLQYDLADQLGDEVGLFDDELIEGAIGRGAMVVLYGASNSGKTFAAIDMGAAVARGSEWLGRPTDSGLVVYLATESPASVQTRLRAYQRHHGLRVPGFVIVRSPVNLFDGTADTDAIVELVKDLESEHGTKVALIFGDTLARLVAGGNENDGKDMGVVVRNVDAIRNATGAAFVLIHHSGKDAARGARGWSGLQAAIDTEIEVTADEVSGIRTAEITKQRDLPGKGERLGFRLVPVELGVNRWGTSRGSCVVVPTEAPSKPLRGKRQSEIAGAITEFLTERGSGCIRGALVKHFDGRYVRQSVYREITKMVESGALIHVGESVALPGRPGASS